MLQKGLFTVFIFSLQVGLCFGQKMQTYLVPIFQNSANVIEVDVEINHLPARFIFDPGATMVSFDKTFYNRLLQNNSISGADIKYHTKTRLADGSLADALVVNIRKLRLGSLELNNIDAMVELVADAPALLGQSVIKKFSSFTVDNDNQKLIFTRIIPASVTVQNVNYVPCSQSDVDAIKQIKNTLEADDNIDFTASTVEQRIPTNPNALKRITHKITIRFFDQDEQSDALFIQERIINMGYEKIDVFVEDMTSLYPTPIKSYIEIWLK